MENNFIVDVVKKAANGLLKEKYLQDMNMLSEKNLSWELSQIFSFPVEVKMGEYNKFTSAYELIFNYYGEEYSFVLSVNSK